MGLTKTLALETARTPVTCNAICPGWVLTPLVQQQIDKRIAAGTDPQRARDELLAEKQPSQAFVTPEQLGELALFLCSDAAAQVRGAATWTAVGWRSSEFSRSATRSVVISCHKLIPLRDGLPAAIIFICYLLFYSRIITPVYFG